MKNLTVLVLALVVMGTAGCMILGESGGERTDLERRQQQWAALRIEAYAFTYQITCFCLPEWRGPFDVVVREGKVMSVHYEGQPMDLSERTFYTIDALFDLLDDAYRRNAAQIDVTYNPQFGYPESLNIDYDHQIADEELGVTVTSFTPHR